MTIIKDKINLIELKSMAEKMFGNLVKGVVDIEKEIIALDAPMHSDEETELIKDGSSQENLWGFNLYPEKQGEEFIEFDSMINLRPSQGNRSRGVDDLKIRKKITQIVNKWIKK